MLLRQNNKFIKMTKMVFPMQFQKSAGIFSWHLIELFDAASEEIMRSPRQMPTSIIHDNQCSDLLSDDPKAINRFCTRYHVIYSYQKSYIELS